jgi:hypothetical protein
MRYFVVRPQRGPQKVRDVPVSPPPNLERAEGALNAAKRP